MINDLSLLILSTYTLIVSLYNILFKKIIAGTTYFITGKKNKIHIHLPTYIMYNTDIGNDNLLVPVGIIALEMAGNQISFRITILYAVPCVGLASVYGVYL
jgi:hypothetical protein